VFAGLPSGPLQVVGAEITEVAVDEPISGRRGDLSGGERRSLAPDFPV